MTVILGSGGERPLADLVRTSVPEAVDLTGATSLSDLVRLGRASAGVVGNDTGPVHLLAVAGAPTVVLFSRASDPDLCAPRGARVRVLRESDLSQLGIAPVAAALGAVRASTLLQG